jgi:hypothetical protein
VELVAIAREDEPIAWVVIPGENQQAHGGILAKPRAFLAA